MKKRKILIDMWPPPNAEQGGSKTSHELENKKILEAYVQDCTLLLPSIRFGLVW